MYSNASFSLLLVLISDTSGDEDYDRLRPLSYLDANLVLLCCDCADPIKGRKSLEAISQRWLPEIRHVLPKSIIVLVGTKLDLASASNPDLVTEEELRVLALTLGIEASITCSVKSGAGLPQLNDLIGRYERLMPKVVVIIHFNALQVKLVQREDFKSPSANLRWKDASKMVRLC